MDMATVYLVIIGAIFLWTIVFLFVVMKTVKNPKVSLVPLKVIFWVYIIIALIIVAISALYIYNPLLHNLFDLWRQKDMAANHYNRYLGYKFFREQEGKIQIIRVVRVKEFNDKFIVVDQETKKKSTITIGELKKFTPLEPKGCILFLAVIIKNGKENIDDVIVSLYDMFQIKLRDGDPYAICRQGVNDIFYDTIRTDEEQEVAGCCISHDECPQNIPYKSLQFFHDLKRSDFVNFYMDDTVDDVLECLDLTLYDNILEEHFHTASNNMFRNDPKRRQFNGWCRSLKILLEENSFITEFDALRNILAVDCDLKEHLVEKNVEEYYEADQVLKVFLMNTYKINIKQVIVIKFDYDIDLAEFQNDAYIFIRDNTNTLYFVVYIEEGQYLEADLQEEAEKLSVSDQIRLNYYNKYKDIYVSPLD